MDLHNLFHFLKLRLDHHAQWEIRQYAEAIYELIRPIVPVSCEAFDEYILKADSFSATEMGILKILVEDSPKLRSLISETDLGKRDVVEFLNKLGITE